MKLKFFKLTERERERERERKGIVFYTPAAYVLTYDPLHLKVFFYR